MRPAPRLILVAAACLAAVGCAGPAPSVVTVRTPLVDSRRGVPDPDRGPDCRRRCRHVRALAPCAIAPSPAVAEAAEAACRAQDGVEQLPLRVLDAAARPLTLVFADDDAAVVCHAAVTEDGTVIGRRACPVGAVAAQAPAEGKLGAYDLEVIEAPSGPRVVIVGRVVGRARGVGQLRRRDLGPDVDGRRLVHRLVAPGGAARSPSRPWTAGTW